MAEPEAVLYRNWMKAGPAFLYTKRGIQGFIEDFIDQYSIRLYNKVLSKLGHAPGTQCTSCSIYNILQCPTKGICSGKNCTFHDSRDPRKRWKQCPLNICDAIRDALRNVHRGNGGPSFRNTMAEDWCTSSWEIAKCFLQPTGYQKVRTADQTDFPGLLSILQNNLEFAAEFTENLSIKNNIFEQLQNDIITITKAEEEQLKEESRRAIKQAVEEGKEILEKETDKGVAKISEAAVETFKEFEDKKVEVDTAVGAFKTAANSATTALQTAKDDVMNTFNDKQKDIETTLDAKTKDCLSEIDENIKTSVQKLQIRQVDEKSYMEDKIKLRNSLIDQYEKNFCAMPFSPLIQEEDVAVDRLFVMPSIRIINHNLPRLYNGSLRYTYLKGFSEIMQKDSRLARRVYLLSDAGRGKTTLCQMMIKTWCKAHSATEFKTLGKDEAFLKSFEFLFYLPLRSLTHLFQATDMIKELLVRKKFHGLLDLVMQEDSDKCILILDGLDEWTAPDSDASMLDKHKNILPFVDQRENFTMLTTSRPWKLELLRLKSSKIDQEVELLGTTEDTAKELVEKLVTLLNHKFGRSKKMETFMKEIRERNLVHFTGIPFILMQVVCLWHDGREYGNTQVEVYHSMLNYLLELAHERLEDGEEMPTKDITDGILGNVAKLAFKTLFRENKASLIVFPRSVTQPFDIPKTDIAFCLTAGLLSQSKHMEFAATRMKSLSFVHKTFHEFFAAKFIASGDGTVDDIFNKLNDMDTIFEMERVIVFLSGLKPDIINRIILHIADTTDTDEGFLEYRKSVSYRRYFNLEENVLRLQNLIIECLDEGFRDDFSQLNLVLRDITTLDFYNKFTEKHKTRVPVDGVRSLAVEHTEIPFVLAPILTNNVSSITKIRGYVSSQDQIDVLRNAIGQSQDTIKCLSICSSRYAKPVLKDGLYLGDLFQSVDKLLHLECIEFECIDLTHSRIEELIGFIKGKTTLRQVVLCDISCTSCNSGECSYNLDLSKHSQLELITLTSLYLNEIRLNVSKLHSCHMYSLRRPSCVTSILRRLKESRLTSLIFTKGIAKDSHAAYADSIEVLTEVVPTLRNLEYISLKGVLFDRSNLFLSREMVNLEYVSLGHMTMDLSSLKAFMGRFPHVDNDFEVLLDTVYIEPIEHMTDAIQEVMDSERFHVLDNFTTDKYLSVRLQQNRPQDN